MINPLEAVADAIQVFEGWKPGSRSYRNRNPGNLEGGGGRSVGVDGVYNVYNSLVDGYQDLLDDLHGKFSGRNRHNLVPTSTLFDLMSVYAPPSENPTAKYATFIASQLTIALGRSVAPTDTLESIWKAPTVTNS